MKAQISDSIISLKIDAKLNEMLEKFAQKYDRSKSYIMRKALKSYLEDQLDLEEGMKALIEGKKNNKKTTNLDKLIRKYGLEN
jgi:predicted transcriptional regulator